LLTDTTQKGAPHRAGAYVNKFKAGSSRMKSLMAGGASESDSAVAGYREAWEDGPPE